MGGERARRGQPTHMSHFYSGGTRLQSVLYARIVIAVDRNCSLLEANVVDPVQDAVAREEVSARRRYSEQHIPRRLAQAHKLTLREVAVVSSASGGASGELVAAMAGLGSFDLWLSGGQVLDRLYCGCSRRAGSTRCGERKSSAPGCRSAVGASAGRLAFASLVE